jgi:signal transduction histidine kinase
LSLDLNILSNVYGDPRRFVQIMQNFLSNALKFTEKGGDVTVKVSILEIQDINSEEKKNHLKQALEENLSSKKNK